MIASLALFGLVGVPNSSFDVVTAHPTSTQESRHEAPIDSFIAGVTAPPYRITRPYYPTIVLGDFNALADTSRMTLPNETPCRPQTEDPAMRFFSDRSFSDHCGLLVRFSE